jgi:integrase
MGLYKRCDCRGRRRERCGHPWWGSFRGQRISLGKWADCHVDSKPEAQAVLDEVRLAIRQGTFTLAGRRARPVDVLTFSQLADFYWERDGRKLKSADTLKYRLEGLKAHFADRAPGDIRAGDIEDFLAGLEQPGRFQKRHATVRERQPSTINRWRALLRRVFSWAVENDYLDRTPFNKPGVRASLVKARPENDSRDRRLSDSEFRRLMATAGPRLKPLIVVALYTGMRRGEMLKLTWSDLDAHPGWIRLRSRTTKSGRPRILPIHPDVQAVFDFLRTDAMGQPKPSAAPVFSNEVGEPVRNFREAWSGALKRAGIIGFRWHDLRHEFGSRNLECGASIIHVRDLLGHSDVKMTQRYLNLTDDNLRAQVHKLPSLTNLDDRLPSADKVSQSLHTPASAQTDALSGPSFDRRIS